MRAKTLVAVLLLVHLLAHPVMHAFLAPDAATAAGTAFLNGGDNQSRARPESSNCYLCRTAHALFAPLGTDGASLAAVAEAHCAVPPAKPEAAWRRTLPARAPPIA